jgi:PAS domain S-box-containing protein
VYKKSSVKSDSVAIFSPYKRFKQDDWFLEKGDYSIKFEIIDNNIIYTKANGSLKERYVQDFFNLHRKVLEYIKNPEKGYYRISNWKELKDVSWKARRLYLDGLKKLDQNYTCLFSVVFGTNRFMNSLINISRQFTPFQISSANSLKEALNIIEQAKQNKIAVKQGKKTKKQSYNEEQLNRYIEELLMYMGEIEWDKKNLKKKRLSLESHPFRSIYESLFIIKQDFDSVLKDKKKAEKDLLIEKSYLEQLFENPNDAIAMGDRDSKLLSVNSSFTRQFGYREDEALGRFIDDLITPEELREEATSMRALLLAGKKVEYETRRKHKNGRIIDVWIKVSPIIIDNNFVGAYSIWQNIAERKRAERVQDVLFNISNAATQTMSLEDLLSFVHKGVHLLMDARNFLSR